MFGSEKISLLKLKKIELRKDGRAIFFRKEYDSRLYIYELNTSNKKAAPFYQVSSFLIA